MNAACIIPLVTALSLAVCGPLPAFAESPIPVGRALSSLVPWWASDMDFGFFHQNASSPRFDWKETDKQFIVSTEVPGFEPTDINVEVTKDTLTIRGKRASDEVSSKESESSQQITFQRSMALPAEVDPDQAEATLKNGVLKMILPKSSPEKIAARKLTIKTN
jgi:HSP20 family protein